MDIIAKIHEVHFWWNYTLGYVGYDYVLSTIKNWQ